MFRVSLLMQSLTMAVCSSYMALLYYPTLWMNCPCIQIEPLCFALGPGKSPYLLFTNRHEIRRVDLVKREYSQVVSTQKNTVALDLDVANNRIFWCDRFHRRIYR